MPIRSGAMQRPSGLQVRQHVAPEVRRGGIAVQQHDGVALSHLHVRHLAAEDPPPRFLVRKCRRDHVRFSCSSRLRCLRAALRAPDGRPSPSARSFALPGRRSGAEARQSRCLLPPLEPAVTSTARSRQRWFHLVFESHDGRCYGAAAWILHPSFAVNRWSCPCRR
jgi:hypothetical protein